MVRIKHLLSVSLATLVGGALALLAPASAIAETSGCSAPVSSTIGCPAVGGEIVGDAVEVGGHLSRPGDGAGTDRWEVGTGTGTGVKVGGNRGPGVDLSKDPFNSTLQPHTGPYITPKPKATSDSEPDAVESGPVTLSDLVDFSPAAGVNHMEPGLWTVVGLDTNFYAKSGVQDQHGTLLGETASVRFTPVRYHWTYGDGSAATLFTPGATWHALGVREFDPTATSHIYRESGTYAIDLTIDFAAEYKWSGGPWTPIEGTIPVPANPLTTTVGTAKTVLVDRECTHNPAGPGC